MALPLQPVFDVQLLEELKHVRVGPEEDVQTRLVPVTVLVLPGSNFAPEHITGLDHNRGVAGISQVLGAGQTRQTGPRNGDTHASDHKLKTTLKGDVSSSLPKVVSNSPVAVSDRP